jgi:hypothetical protein
MGKFLSSLLLLLTFLISNGQEPIFNYRKAADNLIHKNFDSSLWKKIICKQVTIDNIDKSTGYGTSGFFQYDEVKFKRRKFSSVTFTYSFFSPTINNLFSFDITLNPKKKAYYVNHIFENVPACVRLNKICGFINKDSAINIAKKDSILYSENLTIALQQSPKTNQFYWVVEGQPKPEPVAKKRNFSSGYGSPGATKYVNANTGELISRQRFFQSL